MNSSSFAPQSEPAGAAVPVVILGFLASLVFVVLAAWRINWEAVVHALQMAAWYPWLLLGIASYLSGQILRGVRLKFLVTADAKLTLATSSNIVVVGYAVNNILPMRMGEFVRAGLLAERTGFPYARSLAVTFLERLFDGLAILLLLVVAAGFVGWQSWIHQVAAVAAGILSLASAVVLLAVLAPQFLVGLVSCMTGGWPASWHNRALALTTQACWGLLSLQSPLLMARIFALSLLVWILEAGLYYFCLPCFGLPLQPQLALIVMAVTNLGILLPSSPGFIGPFHYFCMQTLMSVGVPSELALSYALVVHLGFYVPVTLWGAAAMARYGIELGALAWWRSQAQHLKPLALAELPAQVIASIGSGDKRYVTANLFWQTLCEALTGSGPPALDDSLRREIAAAVAVFSLRQLQLLPWRLYLLLRLGLFCFQLSVIVTNGQVFKIYRLRSVARLYGGGHGGRLA